MSEVRLHTFPYNWDLVIAQTVIKHDIAVDINELSCFDLMTQMLMRRVDAESLWDHWGTVDDEEGRECLVTEPYGHYPEKARLFAALIGTEVSVGEKAEWNRSCTRHRFIPPGKYSNAAQLLGELIKASDWEFKERCKAQDELKALTKQPWYVQN